MIFFFTDDHPTDPSLFLHYIIVLATYQVVMDKIKKVKYPSDV